MNTKPIERAIGIAGSQAALARLLSVHPMQITHWKNRGLPKRWAIPIEQATEGRVTRYELRPDVFGEAHT